MDLTHWIVNNICSVLLISCWLKESTDLENGFLECLTTATWTQLTKLCTMTRIECIDIFVNFLTKYSIITPKEMLEYSTKIFFPFEKCRVMIKFSQLFLIIIAQYKNQTN